MTPNPADDGLGALTCDLVIGISGSTHEQLPALCTKFGLPHPPTLGAGPDGAEKSLTKHERMRAVFEQIKPAGYPAVLARFLDAGLPASERNRAQDLIWSDERIPTIVERTRREIANALGPLVPIWRNAEGYVDLLQKLFVRQTQPETQPQSLTLSILAPSATRSSTNRG